MARNRLPYFTIFNKSKNSICMKKTSILKTMLLASLFVAGAALYENASAQTSTLGGNTADNCAFTGNSSDHCNASDGTNNLRILKCAPGETSCGYDSPTGPVKNPNG